MRKTILLLASMVAALVLASVVAVGVPKEQARAAFPGINGKIVFERDPDGYRGKEDPEIYTIWFNGNNLSRLTNNSTIDSSPAWSADGKRIAFSHSSRDNTYHYSDIYVMNSNGSAKTLITDERKIPGKTRYGDHEPAFSPNGRQIVFIRDTLYYDHIVKIKTDGTGLTHLRSGAYRTRAPSWSPNGNRIAYSDRKDSYEPEEYVITMRPDGTGVKYLTEGLEPDWSPDSSRIIYAYYTQGIYEMDASGTGEKPLTTNAASDPAFSPGGGKIVFSSKRDGDYDLYIMNADGTGDPQQLTNQPGDDYDPAWQPVQ